MKFKQTKSRYLTDTEQSSEERIEITMSLIYPSRNLPRKKSHKAAKQIKKLATKKTKKYETESCQSSSEE